MVYFHLHLPYKINHSCTNFFKMAFWFPKWRSLKPRKAHKNEVHLFSRSRPEEAGIWSYLSKWNDISPTSGGCCSLKFSHQKRGGLHVSETLPFGSPKSSNLVKWNNISPSFGFPWNKEISLPYVPLGRCGDPMGLISGLSAIDTVESFNPRFPRDLGKQRRFPGCFWWMWML